MKKTIINNIDPVRSLSKRFTDLSNVVFMAKRTHDVVLFQKAKKNATELFYSTCTLCQNNFMNPKFWNVQTDYIKEQTHKVMNCQNFDDLSIIGERKYRQSKEKKGRPKKSTL